MGNAHWAFFGIVKTAIAVAALMFLLPTVWLFTVYNGKHRACIALENGLNLGYEAVFDLSRPYFRPIAVPKFQDGTPLIHDKTWEIFVTDTTIYGLALGQTSESDYRFAWRADTGLVRQQNDKATYEALTANAGHANWDIEIDSVGTGWLLDELIRRQQHTIKRCPTWFLTW
jgi:hypothetical protein